MKLFAEMNREQLREAAADALAVLPIGATEQHGPHLPTVLSSIRKQYGVDAPIELSITPTTMPQIELRFGQKAARLALKMCSALASTLSAFRPDELFLASRRSREEIRWHGNA